MNILYSDWQSIDLNSFTSALDTSFSQSDALLDSLDYATYNTTETNTFIAGAYYNGSYSFQMTGNHFIDSFPVVTMSSVIIYNASTSISIYGNATVDYDSGLYGGSITQINFSNTLTNTKYQFLGQFYFNQFTGDLSNGVVTSMYYNVGAYKFSLAGGFNINSNGDVISGTVNSFSFADAGGHKLSVSGISLNWTTFDSLTDPLTGHVNLSDLYNIITDPARFAGNDTITADALNNAISSFAGNDVLNGGAGDDTLDGGTGADTMNGGAGNDLYVVDNLGDVVNESANAVTGGIDTVQSSVTQTLSAYVENLALTGAANINGTGNTLANTIIGNSGNNSINGGTGADTMTGGAGNDIYVVDNIGDIVTELLNEGTDTIKSSITYSLIDTDGAGTEGGNVENLTLIGTANINGTGNDLANILIGNAGNNSLDGGLGADGMTGGLGNDTYVVDDAGDAVTELAAGGTDTVQSSVDYTLGANLENLTLTSTADINGTGNALANNIVGNSGINTLTGNAGNDTLDGGAGADTLIGGDGSDTYFVDDVGDVVTEANSVLATGGTDTVKSSVDFDLLTRGANVEKLTLTGTAISGTGNALANIITGNASNNSISGGAGVDTLIGGLGDDTYTVDLIQTGTTAATFRVALQDVITEAAVAGTDSLILTGNFAHNNATTLTLAATLENIDVSQTGLTKLNLTGNAAANNIIGNAANNIINGGAGVDTMTGGDGDDTYTVDNTNETIVELFNQGADTVNTSVSFDLLAHGANVENLTLTGTANINGTGNTENNTIIGNSGNNTIDGGVGADIMRGGNGSDTYFVDNTNDVVIETNALAAGGIDEIIAASALGPAVTFTLGDNIENLTLTGIFDSNGAGNALNNYLTGSQAYNILEGRAGNDTLTGGNGADTLIGGIGNDIYIVDDLQDTITEALNEGADTIQSVVNFDLSAKNATTLVNLYDNIENLTLIGTANVNATGSAIANVITGNVGNNILKGDGVVDTIVDVDTLQGGKGNDTYWMTLTQVGLIPATATVKFEDKVIENLNEGNDSIRVIGNFSSLATYSTITLTANVERLYFNDTTVLNNKLNAVGNALSNWIEGNNEANRIDGGEGNDSLLGGAGIDTLIGGLGNDALQGGTGVDSLIGGAGNDGYYVDLILNATNDGVVLEDTIVEAVGGGSDFISLSGSAAQLAQLTALTNATTITLAATMESITIAGATGIKLNLTGNTSSNYMIGNNLGNIITALAGNDILDGGAGADTLIGGVGNDTYIIDNVLDVVTELAGGGIDTIESTVSFSLLDTDGAGANGGNVEHLILTGVAAINATGNAVANTLIGNSGNNSIDGGAGNDTIFGDATNASTTVAGGNDTLNGGTGNDTMIGGNGNDVYIVDSISDVVTETNALALGGVDEVQASVTRTLGLNFEKLTLTGTANINGTGNALANTIAGNDGNNALNGLAGNDTISGGIGNDTLTGGDGKDALSGGTGADTFDFNLSTESATGVNHDIISDFSTLDLDKIDLSTIDAKSAVAGNQAFTFIGTDIAFSNVAGQLRFDSTTSSVFGDVDGDGVADFQIELMGVTSLSASDFIL